MKQVILINALSGAGLGKALLEYLQTTGKNEGLEFEAISFPVDSRNLEKYQDYQRIFVAGGDGTISGIGARFVDSTAAIIPLPIGTGNDLARELKVAPQRNINSCMRLIKSSSDFIKRKLSLWRVKRNEEQLIMMNYCSLGFDAKVVHDFALTRGHPSGSVIQIIRNRLNFTKIACKNCYSTIPTEGLLINKQSINKNIRSLLFSNIKSIMGIGYSNQQGDFSDNKLEFLSINSIMQYVGMVWPCNYLFSPPKLLMSERYYEVVGLNPELYLQIDGEGLGILGTSTLHISLHGQIEILTPGNL